MARVRRQLSEYFYPDRDEPGWYRWTPEASSSFAGLYGLVRVLPKGPGRARVKITPDTHLNSSTGAIHGGAIAGYVDIAIFAGSVGSGVSMPDGARYSSVSRSLPGYSCTGRIRVDSNSCGNERFITLRFSRTYDTPDGHRRLSSST